MRYQRQEMLEDFKDSRSILQNKKVAIVGTGGLGGLFSLLLVGAGVINLKISDSDEVDISNLHRQILFKENDVGHSKTECVRRELLALDKKANIEVFKKINKDNFFDFAHDVDLVADLSDNIETRLLISNLCVQHKKDFLHTSVAAYTGLLMAMQYSKDAFIKEHGCYRCMTGDISSIEKSGITGPSASMMSAAAAQMALQMLLNKFEDSGFLYRFSLKDFKVQKLKLIADNNCPICSQRR